MSGGITITGGRGVAEAEGTGGGAGWQYPEAVSPFGDFFIYFRPVYQALRGKPLRVIGEIARIGGIGFQDA